MVLAVGVGAGQGTEGALAQQEPGGEAGGQGRAHLWHIPFSLAWEEPWLGGGTLAKCWNRLIARSSSSSSSQGTSSSGIPRVSAGGTAGVAVVTGRYKYLFVKVTEHKATVCKQ